jgi:hypothetical protein
MFRTRKTGIGLRICCLLAAICLGGLWMSPACAQPDTPAAGKPLYRDPVHDGAADPSLIFDRATGKWLMFYTNRRADMPVIPGDVRWVHGTHIGVAQSADGGRTWKYVGEAKIPFGKPDYTFWAPAVVYAAGEYHMFVAVVPGIFSNWDAPREIIHLTSRDLSSWRFADELHLSSDRVIDPYLLQMPDGTWRMWYKDERDHAHIHSVDSTDLVHWTHEAVAVQDRSSEGPIVFAWHGRYWMIVDMWKGLGVYRSSDLTHWTAQADNLLSQPGTQATDRSLGHHADVVLHGSHAYLFYFVHQEGEDAAGQPAGWARRSVIQVVALEEKDGRLLADRNRPTTVELGTGQ